MPLIHRNCTASVKDEVLFTDVKRQASQGPGYKVWTVEKLENQTCQAKRGLKMPP